MRRSDREVTQAAEIHEIMDRCDVCRLGLVDDGEAYIVPLNYGYVCEGEQISLYFHGALVGRKVDLIRRTGRASFEMDCTHQLIEGETAQAHSYAYECVMGTGAIRLLEDEAEKAAGLNAMMRHLTGRTFEFEAKILNRTAVFRLDVETISAKRRPKPM